jgi:hypothetical protein
LCPYGDVVFIDVQFGEQGLHSLPFTAEDAFAKLDHRI